MLARGARVSRAFTVAGEISRAGEGRLRSADDRSGRSSALRVLSALRRGLAGLAIALLWSVVIVPVSEASAATNPPGSFIHTRNIFYAYVGAGQNLDVSFVKLQNDAGTVDVPITIEGPGGVTQSCTLTGASAAGTACTRNNLTSATPGVWRITFGAPDGFGGAAVDRTTWTINVQTGTTNVPGRVWTDRHTMTQTGAAINLPLWYISEQGFKYAAMFENYQGVGSIILSNATGAALLGTCQSAYISYDTDNVSPTTSQYYVPVDQCGEPYHIFFEAPDAAMPDTALAWDGTTEWVNPPVVLPTITNLAFAQDPAQLVRVGEFTVDVANFVGNATIEIDANNDGDYTDPEDRIIPIGVATPGAQTVPFDGLDGQGIPIPATREITARVLIDQIGEIHFPNWDVEQRGDLQITALNGPSSGSRTLYWNDTNLASRPACDLPVAERDGRAGVDSTGGVHGWDCAAAVGNWGDQRLIDDWTYQVGDFQAAVVIPAIPIDFGDAPDSFGTSAAANGARHAVQPGLMIGSLIDAEADGQPSAAADGDGTDEDAFSSQVVLNPGATAATLTVPVTNSTGAAATLYGWIDANGNGVFGASEFASVVVPDGATSVDLAFAGLAPFQDGSTPMIRLRLTSDALTDDAGTTGVDERALGAVSDGEVEDHLAQVATPVPVSCVAPFVADFGTGTGYGPPLPDGQTTYLWEGSGVVQDGEYALVSALPGSTGSFWHTGSDHTVGDTDGRLMLINASLTEGIFFQRTFTQLVSGADYDFAAWITNANRVNSPTLPNVTFRVVNPATGVVLAEDTTGSISNKSSLVWERFSLPFTASQPTVRLELVNNAPGGNGNDLAIDDISFSSVCEFGDAPDSYGTLISSNGAGHVASGPTLGAARDTEPDGQPTVSADGDGTTGAPDDEDGVAGPIEFVVNEPSRVTVSATNNGDVDVTLAGWVDLDGDGQFQLSERVTVVVPANSGTADYALDFPAGTMATDTYARFRIYGQLVADPQPTGSAAGGEVEDYLVTLLVPALEVEKTSDATADARMGDVVTYTVTATNTGTGGFTAANPAVVLDDLSGLLDDATYNGDAAASMGADPSFSSPLISWSGPLPAGESVSVTYTVTLVAGGDGVVRNVAFVPPCDPADDGCEPVTPACDPPVGGVDPVTGEPCAEVEFLLPRLTHTKVADTTELPADGGVVNYTVTVTNQGPGVFTVAEPGVMRDDLSQVLDDAAYNGDASATTGSVTFNAAAQRIEWSGALGVGATATITYSVTYDANAGDHVLLNVACLPVEHAQDPTDPCRSVQIPGSALQDRKTSNPASGSSVVSGQQVTYTLHFENTGAADASVDTFDEMVEVLDDATLTAGPTTSNPALTAMVNGTRIDITGTVPVGATYTVSYTVTVNAFEDQDDHILANVLGECLAFDPTCRTEHLVKHITVTKTSDAVSGVNTGDTVEYRVTVTNDGEGDYTAAASAVARDDLTGVLDDAIYGDDAAATTGTVSYTEPLITWSGPLASGASASFTYTVVVTNAGDHVLENVAGPVCSDPEFCGPDVTVIVLLPYVVPSKSSDPAPGVALAAGDVVTYTLSWTNTGEAEGPVDSTDDLLDVLDDGDVTSEPVSSDAAVTAVRTGDEIRITGMIQPDQTITVTYQVTIKPDGERGNNRARNILIPDVPPCLDEAECPPPVTVHLIGELDDWKTVDPAFGMTVQPGQVVTYTLHFENIGQADVSVDKDDVLTQVLDDATITDLPVSSDAALTVSPIDVDRFTVSGTLAAGQLVTVTYTVTVNPDGERGDDRLGNFLVDGGVDPPVECIPADPQRPDCTINHVSNVVPSKSSDPPSGTSVSAGERVTFTLTFENVSSNAQAADGPVDYIDHLADVLDDATLTTDPVSSHPAVRATVLTDSIRVVGAIPSGVTVTVVYTVTVEAYPEQGNHLLGNVIAQNGVDPICAPGSTLCTFHELPSLAFSGVEISRIAVFIALALLLLGGAAITVSRRRSSTIDVVTEIRVPTMHGARSV